MWIASKQAYVLVKTNLVFKILPYASLNILSISDISYAFIVLFIVTKHFPRWWEIGHVETSVIIGRFEVLEFG